MDARGFVTQKHDAAVEELRALDAEFNARKQSAQAMIDLTKKWLEELAGEQASKDTYGSVQEVLKSSSDKWVSSRDLNPQSRASVA